jgi:hypothetical protein
LEAVPPSEAWGHTMLWWRTHLSWPVLPHIHKICNLTHLFKGLNIMGFTVWMEPLLGFVPREIALVFSQLTLCACHLCVYMSNMWIVKYNDCIKTHLIYACSFVL